MRIWIQDLKYPQSRNSKTKKNYVYDCLQYPDSEVQEDTGIGLTNLKVKRSPTERSIYYRKHILQITQPSEYRYTQLQYRFAVISEAPSSFKFVKQQIQI